MRKREELTNPASCMSRAREGEMTFVLLGRDEAAPDAIRYWAERRVDLGKNQVGDAQLAEAEACARTMEAERGGNPSAETRVNEPTQGDRYRAELLLADRVGTLYYERNLKVLTQALADVRAEGRKEGTSSRDIEVERLAAEVETLTAERDGARAEAAELRTDLHAACNALQAAVSRAEVAEGDAAELREACEMVSADMHAVSSRPCETCRRVSKAIDKPFGCYAW